MASAMAIALIATFGYLAWPVDAVTAQHGGQPATVITSHVEGEPIDLNLDGIRVTACETGSPSVMPTKIRLKFSDDDGLHVSNFEADLSPDANGAALIEIPAGKFVAGEYRAIYYVQAPLCIQTDYHLDELGLDVLVGLSETAYWGEGQLSYVVTEPYREECCTALQIIVLVIAGIVGLICLVCIWEAGGESVGSFVGGAIVGFLVFLEWPSSRFLITDLLVIESHQTQSIRDTESPHPTQ